MSIRQPAAIVILMIMAMSLVWSKALLSFTMGLLAVVAIIDIRISPFRIKWLLTIPNIRNSIRAKPSMWGLTLFSFLYIFSILYAGDIGEWWNLTHMKMAFLLMPMSFALLGNFNRREVMLILIPMLMTAVWSTIWVQVAYYSHFHLFSQSLGFGGSLPTPMHHIRYSVVIAISMIICLGFAIENWKLKYNWERWAYGISSAYLFYFLHILSVRSGLMIAYAGVFIICIFYLRKLKVWKQLALIAALIIVPFIAYKTLPGFQLKVNYTIYDLGKFKQGEGNDYSDSERWQSWHAGLMIGNKHPFLGTGTGHFKSELETYYKTELKQDSWTRPHNQWINEFAKLGLIGLIVFSFSIIHPMMYGIFWKTALFPTIYIMQLLTMMVEHPLDTEFGTKIFLMMTLLGLSYHSTLLISTAARETDAP
ncbi:MAG: O-antigen ligase family protein [Saprospiraceae bacterium]